MSLFGQPTANTGFGGFGVANQGANTTGAAAGSAPAGSSLFGTANTGTTNAGGGLFGAQPAAPTGTTGGLFGQNAAQNPPKLNLFGQPAAGATGGGLFGQQQQAAPTTNTGGTGLFGQTQQPATTGTTGLFGQTQQGTSQAATTGGTGLFGQPAQNAQQPAAGAGLFGQQAAGTTTGLFGQQTTNNSAAGTTNTSTFGQPAANATGGGLFGQPAQAAGNTGGGLFGAKPAGGGLFGTQPAAQGTGGGLFGGLNQTKPFGTTLNTQPTLALTQSQLQQPQAPSQIQQVTEIGMKLLQLQQAVQANGEALAVVNRLGQLVTSLASEKFQYVFYNMVDPAQVSLYARPVDIGDAMWEKAMKENPDPRCMVPAFAVGMGDLQKRVEAQTKTSEAHKAKLEELRQRLTKLSERHILNTTLASERLSAQHSVLSQRVLSLMQHLHLLIPAIRSTAIRPEEERLRTELDAVEEEVRRGSVGKGKLNELWGVVGQLAAVKGQAGMGAGNGGREGMEWRVVDQQGLEQLTWVLSEQQQGLAHLTKLLKENLRDLAVIFEHTGGAPS